MTNNEVYFDKMQVFLLEMHFYSFSVALSASWVVGGLGVE